jgi:hypothetical protein
MIPPRSSADHILWRVGAGFAIIIALCWLFEILQVPHRYFGEAAGFNWPRVLVRTVVLFSVWTWMHVTVRQLLKRLHHLEEFLLVCSWCRKLCHDGHWLTTEEYFGSRFETETSHGMCPACSREQRAEIAASREAAVLAQPGK